jgi:hypothetical protein
VVPDVKAKRRTERATMQATIARLERELAAARAVAMPVPIVREERPVHAVPKPQRRVVARDTVADFRATHPGCAVLGCSEGDADPHHIIPRSHARSSDDERNLLNLHRGHHDEWHTIGREAFLSRYGKRLSHANLLKIKLAAEIEAEAALMGRPAIELDDEGQTA